MGDAAKVGKICKRSRFKKRRNFSASAKPRSNSSARPASLKCTSLAIARCACWSPRSGAISVNIASRSECEAAHERHANHQRVGARRTRHRTGDGGQRTRSDRVLGRGRARRRERCLQSDHQTRAHDGSALVRRGTASWLRQVFGEIAALASTCQDEGQTSKDPAQIH
jgi:hypothetical protein